MLPAFPAHAPTAILRICQKAHESAIDSEKGKLHGNPYLIISKDVAQRPYEIHSFNCIIGLDTDSTAI